MAHKIIPRKGHANVNTTQIYVRTREDVARAIAMAVSA
jgi:hypothetical protein